MAGAESGARPAGQRLLPENFYTEGVEHGEYIEQRSGGFYVAGTRVSLDSIVYSFRAGDSPETIRQYSLHSV